VSITPPPSPPPAPDLELAGADGAPAGTAPDPAVVSWWKVGALGAVALGGCAYVALYDPNTASALYPACPFKVITGLDCPGCGITRALHALFNGNPAQALDQNLLFVIALPFLLLWLARGVWTSVTGRPRPPSVRWTPTMTWALVGLGGAFWVVRNLPWSPFDWLASGLL
jgi:hypothetical protein